MATQRRRISRTERKPLTAERLRQLFTYDPQTGLFSRLMAPRPQAAHYVGQPVGYIKPGPVSAGGGYLMVSADGGSYRAHRLAWLYMTGEWPEADVDHRDRDRQNNRWANLRAATRSQNIHNMGMRERNTSGRKGAIWDAHRGKWQARITINGKHAFLGRFETRDAAGDAYDAAAEKHFGDFAKGAA